jgi:hypothetical protein
LFKSHISSNGQCLMVPWFLLQELLNGFFATKHIT